MNPKRVSRPATQPVREPYISLTINDVTIKAKIYGNGLTVITIQHNDSTSSIILKDINSINESEYPDYVKVPIQVIKHVVSEFKPYEDELRKIGDSAVFYAEPEY